MKNQLVAYFSPGGTTARLAGQIARAADADLFEIRPEVPYSRADLDWNNPKSRSSVEMKDPASRPGVRDRIGNLSQYDTVFVGFPIWWYQAPTIINTFLEENDLSGKTIVLFATSGGSGFGDTAEKLRSSLPDSAKIISGGVLNGHPSDRKLSAWMEKLGL